MDETLRFVVPPRRVLVTGATSGIGEATAREFARNGLSVWLTYANHRRAAEDVAQACRDLGAVDARVSQLDLGDPTSIQTLADDVAAAWPSVHVLVNNAAICLYRDIDAIGVEDWDTTMESNVRGTFLLTRALLPGLRSAREAGDDANIVNVSSVAGQIGGVTTSMDYAASKGAILAMTRSFARLLAPERIRVNAVTPGPILSVITAQLNDATRESLVGAIPLGRFGDPAEVAWVIASLASPEASFVTGATYDVNGGVRID